MQTGQQTTVIATLGASVGDVTAALVKSDRIYFRLGARATLIPGGELLTMPAFADHPIGAVVPPVDARGVGADPARWIAALEDRLADLGCGWSRVYLTGAAPDCIANGTEHGS